MYSVQELKEFLREVDFLFPVPLSQKQNLDEFAKKLAEKATLCAVEDGGRIVALVAGYTDGGLDRLGYVSIVATLPSAQGKGYASSLMRQFLDVAKSKRLRAVHLYTARENRAAVHMYQRLGFSEWHSENEPRPHDLHLILYIGEESE